MSCFHSLPRRCVLHGSENVVSACLCDILLASGQGILIDNLRRAWTTFSSVGGVTCRTLDIFFVGISAHDIPFVWCRCNDLNVLYFGDFFQLVSYTMPVRNDSNISWRSFLLFNYCLLALHVRGDRFTKGFQ